MPKPLTPTQFPYTGPYGMSHTAALKNRGPTAVALKRAMWRMGYLKASPPYDDDYDWPLAQALERWDADRSGYGKGRWTKIRAAVVPKGRDHAGELALDAQARALVREEANGTVAQLVYPHPAGERSVVCQGLHPTAGINGNWGIDFCAPGGTPLLAPFSGRIIKVSGHDPSSGEHGSAGIFGWSSYLERPDGLWAYMTHQGRRFVHVGQTVRIGQMIGEVGHWPHNPGRSHTHLGVTSPRGSTDAKRVVTAISVAPRVDL